MKSNLKLSFVTVLAAFSICAIVMAAPDPGKKGSTIDVSDKAAIDAAVDKEVEVEGTVKSAAWSSSGKVMTIKFEKTKETKLTAVVFEGCREKMDQHFSGDLAKALTGAHVKIKGTIEEYKGKPQIKITLPDQITIVEAGK